MTFCLEKKRHIDTEQGKKKTVHRLLCFYQKSMSLPLAEYTGETPLCTTALLPQALQAIARSQVNTDPLYLATFHFSSNQRYLPGFLSHNPYLLYMKILEEYCRSRRRSLQTFNKPLYLYFYPLFYKKKTYAFCGTKSMHKGTSRKLYHKLKSPRCRNRCQRILCDNYQLQTCDERLLLLQKLFPSALSTLIFSYLPTSVRLCLGQNPWETEYHSLKQMIEELHQLLLQAEDTAMDVQSNGSVTFYLHSQ